MPNALTNPGNTSANMLFVSPILANIWYWGIMNIWDGSIICTITRENRRFFPLNLSFANANPAAGGKRHGTEHPKQNQQRRIHIQFHKGQGGDGSQVVLLHPLLRQDGRRNLYALPADLKLVNTIHINGNIISRAPAPRAAYTRGY